MIKEPTICQTCNCVPCECPKVCGTCDETEDDCQCNQYPSLDEVWQKSINDVVEGSKAFPGVGAYFQAIERELAITRDELKAAQGRDASRKEELASLRADLARTQSLLTIKERTNADLESVIKAQEAALANAKVEINDALAQAKQSRASRHAQEELAKNAYAKWQKEKEALFADREHFKTESDRLFELNTSLATDLANARKENGDHVVEIEHLKMDLQGWQESGQQIPTEPVTMAKFRAAFNRTIERIHGLDRKRCLGVFDEMAEHLGLKVRDIQSDEYVLVQVGEAETVKSAIAERESLRADRDRLQAELKDAREGKLVAQLEVSRLSAQLEQRSK